ncbi:hypothetical protein [Paenibacillus ferrarius]|nr:hypothetical protein [Paenibacillus ferrarius]
MSRETIYRLQEPRADKDYGRDVYLAGESGYYKNWKSNHKDAVYGN